MQEAIPYRSRRIDLHTHFTTPPPHSFTINNNGSAELTESSRDNNNKNHKKNEKVVERMVLENAVIVFGRRGCCMSHVAKRLLLGLGVNPVVHELEDSDDEGYFRNINNNKVQFPAVFIGGKFFGGLDRIMATHISGELVPILKQAGALWL
ncbi:Glutaredoxin-C9 [Stylosanthes scabra]|uniref:Glutaredoxin-C9 n=1 Tax=Stylosanthes scabra TaxID=79078 RepID=A0ABU6VL29_9FABA|nr:Glutaredoxin-C9 [Stylosanthes scabra]